MGTGTSRGREAEQTALLSGGANSNALIVSIPCYGLEIPCS
jgi:hypothetical protein